MKQKFIFTCLTLLLSLGCSEEKKKVLPGQISGLVTDWATGTPIDNATITAVINNTYTAKTSEDGTFHLTNLPDSDALLNVSADGYLNEERLIQYDPEAGLNALTRLKLIPANVRLAGQVLLAEAPVANAAVSVRCSGRLLGETVTNEEGQYELTDLELCVNDDYIGFYTVTAEVDTDGDGRADDTQTSSVPANAGENAPTNFTFNEPEPEAPVDTIEVIGSTVKGHIFINNAIPAEGATIVMRDSSANALRQTTADATGAFSFDVPSEFDATYTLFALPLDLDGDGWVDTGTATTTVDWTTNWGNILLNLSQPTYTLPVSNACGAVSSTRILLPSESVYLLWNTSVIPDLVEVVILDPNGQEVPVTATWTGSYLLTLTPDSDFEITGYAGDTYTVQLRSVVFQDGHVNVDPDDAAGTTLCNFNVGERPSYLPSPQPEVDLRPNDIGAMSVTFDENLWYWNVEGASPFSRNLDSLPLVWERVPGASGYAVYGAQSNSASAGADDWKLLTLVNNSDYGSNDQIFTNVNLSRNFDGENGRVLSFGNQIRVIVKPFDSRSHEAPITGDEPSLLIEDLLQPGLTANSLGQGFAIYSTGARTTSMSFTFSEWMDNRVALTSTDLVPFGGRMSAIEVAGQTYWQTYGSPVGTTAVYEDVRVSFNLPSPVTISTGTGDAVVLEGEATGSLDRYALGQTIAVYDATEGAEDVFYGNISAINTTLGALQMSVFGFADEDGDIIFDPCTKTTTLAAEAIDGTNEIRLEAGASLYIGQSIIIGPESGSESRTVTDFAGDVATLNNALNTSHEVGSLVYDSNCESGPGTSSIALRELRTISNEAIIIPTSISGTTTSISLRTNVNLTQIVNGDSLWIDADGNTGTIDDQVIATITGVETMAGDGTGLINDDGTQFNRLVVSDVTALNNTILPLVVDPSDAQIRFLFDGVMLNHDGLLDSSGNGSIDPNRNLAILGADGRIGTVISMP
jgi:hypothetical protein